MCTSHISVRGVRSLELCGRTCLKQASWCCARSGNRKQRSLFARAWRAMRGTFVRSASHTVTRKYAHRSTGRQATLTRTNASGALGGQFCRAPELSSARGTNYCQRRGICVHRMHASAHKPAPWRSPSVWHECANSNGARADNLSTGVSRVDAPAASDRARRALSEHVRERAS